MEEGYRVPTIDEFVEGFEFELFTRREFQIKDIGTEGDKHQFEPVVIENWNKRIMSKIACGSVIFNGIFGVDIDPNIHEGQMLTLYTIPEYLDKEQIRVKV